MWCAERRWPRGRRRREVAAVAHQVACVAATEVAGQGTLAVGLAGILGATQIYVLCIPSRRERAERLMKRWGFLDAEFVQGVDKNAIDIHQCYKDGLTTQEYEDVIFNDVKYNPQGKIACHLGHLSILRKLIGRDDKTYAIIFEDDLEDNFSGNDAHETVAHELQHFLSKVPPDFDFVHLGFVQENQHLRVPVDENQMVFRSVEALGRHAYMVTKQTAQLLIDHTLPMFNHGDKMFQQVYTQLRLNVYQPRAPMFYQDRIHIGSELTDQWKPSRAFQPTEQDDGIRECDRLEMKRRDKLRERALDIARRIEQGVQVQSLSAEDFEVFKQFRQKQGLDLVGAPPLPPASVLFFDVDGVLNATSSPAAATGRPELQPLALLRLLAEAADCALVLTSVRRTDEHWLSRLVVALERGGVPRQRLVGATPLAEGRLTARARASEIRAWLAESGWDGPWAAVDRLHLGSVGDRALAARSVRPSEEVGLSAVDVETLTRMLKQPCS